MNAARPSAAHVAPKTGDSGMLTRLVEDHADFVWRAVRRLGLSAAHADDVTQEVFIVASSKLPHVEAGRERAFLYGIARNLVLHARRSFARSREVTDDDAAREARDSSQNPERQLAEEQAREALDRVLATLSEDLREVFVAFELEEMTMADIALALAIPPGTVASKLRRAREQFHKGAARVVRELEGGTAS